MGLRTNNVMIATETPNRRSHQRIIRRQWVSEWLASGISADVLSARFHDDYHLAFPKYKRRETFWGAAPVARAIKDLREMEAEGMLIARRIGLGINWQPGFPKWCYSYALPPNDPDQRPGKQPKT
jgi:nitroreductase